MEETPGDASEPRYVCSHTDHNEMKSFICRCLTSGRKERSDDLFTLFNWLRFYLIVCEIGFFLMSPQMWTVSITKKPCPSAAPTSFLQTRHISTTQLGTARAAAALSSRRTVVLSRLSSRGRSQRRVKPAGIRFTHRSARRSRVRPRPRSPPRPQRKRQRLHHLCRRGRQQKNKWRMEEEFKKGKMDNTRNERRGSLQKRRDEE